MSTNNGTDIYATGRKGDLRVEFGYGRKSGESNRVQPVMVITHHLRPDRPVPIYLDDAWQWDATNNARGTMINAMMAADQLYGQGFTDRQHVFRIIDAVQEWLEDLIHKEPMLVQTAKEFEKKLENDGVRITATHASGDKIVMLDAR